MHFQEDPQLVVDLDQPEAETIGILPRQPLRKARGCGHLQIIQHYDSANRCLIEREKKGVLSFCRIWWTVHKDQLGVLQAKKRLALGGDVE